jgi:hypothetical protein
MILAYQQEHREVAILPNHMRILALAQTLVDASYGRMTRDIAKSSRASRISTGVPESDMFKGWFGRRPNLKQLRVFGSCVCVWQTGKQRTKLNHHHFDGIFIGYTATDQNIQYIDVTSGVVKWWPHVVFDEAWYLQPSQPPAAQLLYDLGLEDESPTCVTVMILQLLYIHPCHA